MLGVDRMLDFVIDHTLQFLKQEFMHMFGQPKEIAARKGWVTDTDDVAKALVEF